jgi:hypothetical protein
MSDGPVRVPGRCPWCGAPESLDGAFVHAFHCPNVWLPESLWIRKPIEPPEAAARSKVRLERAARAAEQGWAGYNRRRDALRGTGK